MYPPEFDYYRANSVDEALNLVGQHSFAKFIGGGHSLIPAMKLRLADPGVLVDISRIDELKGIARDNGGYRIGALTTHAEVEAGTGLPGALTDAVAWIGDPQVRNVGTVGGNVVHADPASDLPPVFTALGATFHIRGRNGERRVPAEAFFVDLFQTELREDELLTAISVPAEGPNTASAYVQFEHPASGYAIVGAAAQLSVDGNRCNGARVAVGGLTPKATRCPSVEQALAGQILNDETVASAGHAVQDDLGDDIIGDIHASAGYRRQLAEVMVRRAITNAAARV